MYSCICSSCRNLKGVIGEDGAVEVYECIYGYPSERCETCDDSECDVTCSNYIDDENDEETITVRCKTCGKEMQKICCDDEEGQYQCIDCFLKEYN